MTNGKVRVAINGFGQIGRAFFKVAHEDPLIDFVAVNDLSPAHILARALRHDSIYGLFDGTIEPMYRYGNPSNRYMRVGRHELFLSQEKCAEYLPWKRWDVDIVVDATGIFVTKEQLSQHLAAGAKRVILTAPTKDEDVMTFTPNIGENKALESPITSNSSCTTNATNPIIKVLTEAELFVDGLITTVHAYTASQSLVDGLGTDKDPNKGRAAALNIIPSSTGAAKEIVRMAPELAGRFDGVSIRVPVPTVSLVDLVFLPTRSIPSSLVNDLLRKAATKREWEGILNVSEEPLVSTDIIGNPYGCTVDLSMTRTTDHLVKIMFWYDNVWGYCSMLQKHLHVVAKAAGFIEQSPAAL